MADEAPHAIVLAAIKNAPLKLSFLVHLFLVSFAMMGYWSRDAYFFYNLLFFLTLLWTMHSKDSVDAPFMGLLINITAIFLDVLVLCIYFPGHGATDRFSAGMAVLNLLVRPLSSLAVYQVWKERKDASEGRTEAGQGRGYEDIAGRNYGGTTAGPAF